MNYQAINHHQHARHNSIPFFVILVTTCLLAFLALLHFCPTLDNRSASLRRFSARQEYHYAISTQKASIIENSPSSLIYKQSKQKNSDNKTTKIITISQDSPLPPDRSNKEFLIYKPSGCGPDNGFAVDLALIVFSRISHRESRDAVRKTWGDYAISCGSSLYFLIGTEEGAETQKAAQQIALQEEDRLYDDLLQAKVSDTDDTRKSIAMLRYLSENCARVRWVLRTTDRTFVNARSLIYYSEGSYRFYRTIVGNVQRKWTVPRDAKNAYHLPRNVYAADTYPDFVIGPSYLITGDSIHALHEAVQRIESKNIIPLDDIFVTGVVAERANIVRVGERRAWNLKTMVDECNFETMWFSESYSAHDIRTRWERVHTMKCPVNRTSTTTTTTKTSAPRVKS